MFLILCVDGPLKVDLWSSAYYWNAGHSLQLYISSSNFPRYLCLRCLLVLEASHTGAPFSTPCEWTGSLQIQTQACRLTNTPTVRPFVFQFSYSFFVSPALNAGTMVAENTFHFGTAYPAKVVIPFVSYGEVQPSNLEQAYKPVRRFLSVLRTQH